MVSYNGRCSAELRANGEFVIIDNQRKKVVRSWGADTDKDSWGKGYMLFHHTGPVLMQFRGRKYGGTVAKEFGRGLGRDFGRANEVSYKLTNDGSLDLIDNRNGNVKWRAKPARGKFLRFNETLVIGDQMISDNGLYSAELAGNGMFFIRANSTGEIIRNWKPDPIEANREKGYVVQHVEGPMLTVKPRQSNLPVFRIIGFERNSHNENVYRLNNGGKLELDNTFPIEPARFSIATAQL